MKENNYINERIKNPIYSLTINGKEVKRYAFFRQAKQKAQKVGCLFGDKIEIINIETGEIFG